MLATAQCHRIDQFRSLIEVTASLGDTVGLLGESICPYCGVGCRLRVEGEGNQLTKIRGVETATANLGRMCAKGAQLGPTVHAADRVRYPLLRKERSHTLSRSSWEESLDFVANKFRRLIADHGPDSVAFYGSGQLDSETAYLICKLFKGYLGTNNTDSNSRLCMAAAVAGYRSSLGSDGPPTCYEDIDSADVVLVIGSNMAEAHPVTFERLKNSKKNRPDQQIIVVDPRYTATCAIADLHIPLAPGSDIAFLNAIGRLLLIAGKVDEHFIGLHTKGFVEYLTFLMSQNLDELIAATKVSRDLLERAATLIGCGKSFLSFYCMGMNQSTVGMWKNNSLINLHLLTGQIGKVGAGPFSLTGQPNAMGGRECGLLCHQLPGYRVVEDAKHREEMASFWGVSPARLQPKNGLSAVEMFQSLKKGSLKAIWIAATNPMVSLPDLHAVHAGLEQAELVVVSDAYHPTETTRLADVVFPVASWGERAWTSTNSERLVSRSPKLWEAPGEALPDWEILCRFAAKMGFGEAFNYSTNSEVWDEFIRCTKGRPCDMAGITSSRLNDGAALQWPCPDPYHYGTKRRYLDQQFPTNDGRANFLPREHREPFEPTDDDFPFVLTTGRIYAHWHTLTRTGKVEKLMARDGSAYVEIAQQDAQRLEVNEGDLLRLSTRRGSIELPVKIKTGALPGTVFVPMHWGDLYSEGNALNYLTVPAFGPVEKQPELKFCAVNLVKVLPTRHATLASTISLSLELLPANS